MQMTGEQLIAAPRGRVWEALNDPEILRNSIPGCQTLEKQASDHFSAVVEVKVGPIGARFKGDVTLTDLNPPDGYTLNLKGNGGIAGSAKGAAKVQLLEADGGTLVKYQVDAEVGGRMAQLGGPIIDATAKQLAGKFFTRFGQEVTGATGQPAAAAATASAASNSNISSPSSPVAPAAVAKPAGLPIAWILGIALATVLGFLFGNGGAAADSSWAGIAIGLLLIIVAGAAFEYGRRSAAPTVVLDHSLLKRLLEGGN